MLSTSVILGRGEMGLDNFEGLGDPPVGIGLGLDE